MYATDIVELTLFGLFILKMIDTGLVFNANEVKPPSLTATWLERMSESTCSCELHI